MKSKSTVKTKKHIGRPITLPDAEPRACKVCGKVFTPIRKKWKQSCCSTECQLKTWNPHGNFGSHLRKTLNQKLFPRTKTKPRKCKFCGMDFIPPDKTQVFCSRDCYLAFVRNQRNEKTYPKRKGRHAHRIVAEEMMERPLRKGEIVHHKDNNKSNNDPSNLMVLTQSEHINLHRKQLEGGKIKRRTNRLEKIILEEKGKRKNYIRLGKQSVHRIVAEEKLGRKLKEGEIVHHLDRDKHNNKPENLLVTTASEHMKIHHTDLQDRKIVTGWADAEDSK